MNILVVEDNELNSDMLIRRLTRLGFTSTLAVDGETGVRLGREQRPDLILMDLGLPGIDGWEAIEQLKSMPETREIPIIILTAQTSSEDRERAEWAGCAGFLSKPIDLDLLVAKIRRAGPTKR